MINQIQQQQRQTISFEPVQLSLIAKSLEISKLYVTKNPKQFQDSNTILQKINQAISIISSKSNNNIKGASNINNNTICSKKQSLKNLLETFSLYQ